MKKLRFLVLACLTYSCACTDSTPQSGKLVQGYTVQFPLDNYTSYQTVFLKNYITKSGNELLFYLNKNKPSIQIFNVLDRRLYKEIPLNEDGPNGVGSPSGLLVLSMDSIYVISSSHYKLSLINSTGQVLKTYATLRKGESYNENTGMMQPFTISPAVSINNELYFNVAPDRNVYSPEYFKGHTNMKLNLTSGKVSYFNTYPDEFKGNVWGVNATNISTAYAKGKFVYSFVISDSLVVFDPIMSTNSRHWAGSTIDDSKIYPMINKGFDHDLEYVLQQRQYEGIVYDEFRNVYYRFVKHKIPYKNENGEINNFHSKPISIIMLDTDFKVLGETILENDKFVSFMYFVGKEGLYISNANPLNEEINEDFAEFTVFKLQ